MSVELKFCGKQKSDCKSVDITELTGTYVASENEGGWGSPNFDTTDATAADLIVRKRNEDGTLGDAITTDAYPTLPNVSKTVFNLDSKAFGAGAGAEISDGIYEIEYKVTGNASGTPFVYSRKEFLVLQCQIDTCYQKLTSKVSSCDCNCEGIEEELREMALQFRLLEGAKQCGDLDRIQDYLDFITKLCTVCGCGCE